MNIGFCQFLGASPSLLGLMFHVVTFTSFTPNCFGRHRSHDLSLSKQVWVSFRSISIRSPSGCGLPNVTLDFLAYLLNYEKKKILRGFLKLAKTTTLTPNKSVWSSGSFWLPLVYGRGSVSHPERSLSITIFCRPEEMLQPASAGGEFPCSKDCPGVIWTQDGLDRALFTSRRTLGRGLSLEATLCKDRQNHSPVTPHCILLCTSH